MKTVIGSISAAFAVAIMLWCCNGNENKSVASPTPKPVLSIADLMIDKITHSPGASNIPMSTIITLRKYDSLFYKALFVGSDTLQHLFFYSRRGSCCPCSAGGKTCCQCSSGSGFGVPLQAMSQGGIGRIDGGSVFMLAKMSVSPQNTLTLDSRVIDGIKIFTVPDTTAPGTYTISFKGGAIDLSLQIAIDENHNIEISDTP